MSERGAELAPKALACGAALSVGISLVLRALGRKHDALFVGEWAPTLLLLGLYAERYAARRELADMSNYAEWESVAIRQ
jgi:hypothetical protein